MWLTKIFNRINNRQNSKIILHQTLSKFVQLSVSVIWQRMVAEPSTGLVEGFSVPGGNSSVKFCSIAVKKSNLFILASASPGQALFPVRLKATQYLIASINPVYLLTCPKSHEVITLD